MWLRSQLCVLTAQVSNTSCGCLQERTSDRKPMPCCCGETRHDLVCKLRLGTPCRHDAHKLQAQAKDACWVRCTAL